MASAEPVHGFRFGGVHALVRRDRPRVDQVERAKGEPLPRMMTRLTFEGQAFLVSGILDFGDGHGPVVLALLLHDDGPPAAPT